MLGDVPPATFNVELQYTPLVFSAVHPHYYLAHLQNIAVDGAILPVDQVRLDLVCVSCCPVDQMRAFECACLIVDDEGCMRTRPFACFHAVNLAC